MFNLCHFQTRLANSSFDDDSVDKMFVKMVVAIVASGGEVSGELFRARAT